jgi:hypothetical protein
MAPSTKSAAALNDLIVHLRECVVGITQGDSKGTGFFVAENTIVTCAHVLPSTTISVQVQWHNQTKGAQIVRRAAEGEPDLAVLSIADEESRWNHPCVLLGDEMDQNDPLYTFGHPDGDYREGGDSATFDYEGVCYEGPPDHQVELYKFTHGEVAPGLSGSPVLNQRTGKVCAVVLTTRRRESLLGGRAVPIHYLDTLDPHLLPSSRSYHQTHTLWTSLVKQMSEPPDTPPQPAQTAQGATDLSGDRAKLTARLEAQQFAEDKQRRGIVDRARYSVYAEEMITEKTLRNDGSSDVTFYIRGLRTDRGPLVGLRFRFQSESGCVGGPWLDQEAQQHQISWQWECERRSKALPLEDKLRSVKSLGGSFMFDQPLRKEDPPLNIGWTIHVLNGDALSDWEYAHIYSDVRQVHVNRVPLTTPLEYFARMIWFPIKTLRLRLNLPSRIDQAPFLSVFKSADQVSLPEDEVVTQGLLQGMPRADSDWVKRNVNWQRDRIAERYESPSLLPNTKSQKGKSFELTVAEPQVGWCYSLDWILPKPPLNFDFDYLIRQSEEVRQGLLEHAEDRRKVGKERPRTLKIRDLFRSFDAEIRQQYASDKEDCLQMSLMTYHSDRRRMLVVEWAQGGKAAKDFDLHHWDFWLPFGLGLAGACFRGADLQMYVRPQFESEAKAEDADYYLPLTESNPYEALFAFPLDHPEFSDQILAIDPAERCRQLVGVMTIGSTYKATKLLRLRSTKPASPQVAEPEIVILRNRCQGLMKEITDLLAES